MLKILFSLHFIFFIFANASLAASPQSKEVIDTENISIGATEIEQRSTDLRDQELLDEADEFLDSEDMVDFEVVDRELQVELNIIDDELNNEIIDSQKQNKSPQKTATAKETILRKSRN